jgi:hypothetical protein
MSITSICLLKSELAFGKCSGKKEIRCMKRLNFMISEMIPQKNERDMYSLPLNILRKCFFFKPLKKLPIFEP